MQSVIRDWCCTTISIFHVAQFSIYTVRILQLSAYILQSMSLYTGLLWIYANVQTCSQIPEKKKKTASESWLEDIIWQEQSLIGALKQVITQNLSTHLGLGSYPRLKIENMSPAFNLFLNKSDWQTSRGEMRTVQLKNGEKKYFEGVLCSGRESWHHV